MSQDSRKSGQYAQRQRARRRALQALYQWQITKQDAGEIVGQFQASQDLSLIDEGFFEQLVRGVIAEHDSLDSSLQPFLDRPMLQVDVMEKAVLRLGAFELLHYPEVPFRVILDEAIDLAHRFGAEQGHAFVNGVLDKAVKSWRPGAVN